MDNRLPASSGDRGPTLAPQQHATLNERLEAQGVHSIPPEEGLQALGAILARELTEVGVLAIDWTKYAEQFSRLGAAAVSGRSPSRASAGH